MTRQKLYRRSDDVVTRRIAGELILVPIRGRLGDMQRIFTLNSVGQFVWEQLDGTRGAEQIVEAVCGEFEVGENDANADVDQLLAELREAGLIKRME